MLLRIILILSLCGNVAFMIALSRGPVGSAGVIIRRASPRGVGPEKVSRASIVAIGHSEINSIASDNVLSSPFDIRELIQELRLKGVPPHVLHAIVEAIVADRFADQRVKLLSSSDQPFWRHGLPDDTTRSRMAKLAAINRQQHDIVDSLLGVNAHAMDLEQRLTKQRKYGPLSDEKLVAIEKITRDYSELVRKAQTNNTISSAAERANQIGLLQREKVDDVRRLLSVSEFEEYMIRESPAALRLRSALRSLDVSEAEYRKLYSIEDSIDRLRMEVEGGSDRSAQGGKLVQAWAEIYEVLGDGRFSQFASGHNVFGPIAKVATRFDLPMRVVLDVARIKEETQLALRVVSHDGRNLNVQQIRQINSIVSAAENKIIGLIGPAAVIEYKKSGGEWLKSGGR